MKIPSPSHRLTTARVMCVVAAWVVMVVAGFGLLLRHQTTAGEMQLPSRAYPKSAIHLLSPEPHTLLLFAHPRCSCTRASLQELSRLLAKVPGAVNVHVIFPRFVEVGATWDNTPLVQLAASLPGVQITWDDSGRLTQKFGARTSGHVLLYNAQGHLLFSGGLTPLRAHEGTSSGNQAVLAHLRGEKSVTTSAPVFGCSLFDPLAERGVP